MKRLKDFMDTGPGLTLAYFGAIGVLWTVAMYTALFAPPLAMACFIGACTAAGHGIFRTAMWVYNKGLHAGSPAGTAPYPAAAVQGGSTFPAATPGFNNAVAQPAADPTVLQQPLRVSRPLTLKGQP